MPCQGGLGLYDSYMGYLQYVWEWYKIEMQLCRRMVKRRASQSWLNHNTLSTLALPDIQHNKSLETAHRNTFGCSAVINAIFFTHRKKSRRRVMERIKRMENKGTLCLPYHRLVSSSRRWSGGYPEYHWWSRTLQGRWRRWSQGGRLCWALMEKAGLVCIQYVCVSVWVVFCVFEVHVVQYKITYRCFLSSFVLFLQQWLADLTVL